MKKLILFSLLTLCAFDLYAQKTYPLRDTVISIDTINIRGVVYDQYDKPVKNMEIGFYPIGFHPKEYKTSTNTDSNGYFELKGVPPDIGLRILNSKYPGSYFPIRSSRYMVIYLPLPVTRPTTYASDSLIIKARRISPRIKPSFKTKTSDERIFPSYEVQPTFVGGRDKFISYLKQHLIYPKAAVSNNVEGTVEIAFYIEKDGSLASFKVLKGLGNGCDEQVIKHIKNAGKWYPGIYMARPANIQLTVSVEFKLTDK
jgi:TonB family protein